MQKLGCREVDVASYHFKVNKTLGVSFYRNSLVPFPYCSLHKYLSNGLSSDLNLDRMKKLCPREVDIPTYHFCIHKPISVSSYRVMSRVYFRLRYHVGHFLYCSPWWNLCPSSDTNKHHMLKYATGNLTYQLTTSRFTKLLAFTIQGACLGYTISKGMV